MALHSINNALALGIGQLHWDGGRDVALMVGSLLVIAAFTGAAGGAGARTRVAPAQEV